MVQPELHPEDERRQDERDSRQPVANEAAAGVSAPLAAAPVTRGTDDWASVTIAPGGFGNTAASAAAAVAAGALVHPEPTVTTDPRAAAPAGAPAPVAVAGATAWERFAEELITWLKTLASAAVYATLIVTFVCQVARVEGQSMEPTLENQDRLIVNKLVYRIGEPRRNDVVMLYYPLNPDKSFVKRVIGEPGDDVYINDGRVYVNGIPLKDDFIPPRFRSHDDYGPIRVKEGHYFVMGDHRNNSSDSRTWGEVPKKYIIGKVQLRWWPLSTARVFE